jgi:flagellar export protein FliJ
MAFRFPLATVLTLRESMERREERALQLIQMEMARVQRQIESLDEAVAKAHAAMNQSLQAPTFGCELQWALAKCKAALEEKNALLRTLQELEQQRQKQMQIYQLAHRDHETIIKLFHEQRDAYEIEQSRREQKYLDDVFMARRHRA